VATQLRCGGMLSNHFFLQIFHRMCQWRNCENRLIFGEDIDESLWLTFLVTLYMPRPIKNFPSQNATHSPWLLPCYGIPSLVVQRYTCKTDTSRISNCCCCSMHMQLMLSRTKLLMILTLITGTSIREWLLLLSSDAIS